ncbi:unnamed protein product [Darwinula stevensoni]|uniref:RNA methyltransferase n=1 Tax=Darwinula stevensoni TaxID=69355 RepID=A0A7R8X920_9CRUS|nr:unnamed protein product [Darwinula stevensoni]CAG0889239.1 unnamed protein product [Darwinula stevensoni]
MLPEDMSSDVRLVHIKEPGKQNSKMKNLWKRQASWSTQSERSPNKRPRLRRQPWDDQALLRRGGIQPPSDFLLGGNIKDPLNLSSLQDEHVNRAANATPRCSPMTTPSHKKEEVEVLIPININDPLNLDSNYSSPNKQRKHSGRRPNKRKRPSMEFMGCDSEQPKPTIIGKRVRAMSESDVGCLRAMTCRVISKSQLSVASCIQPKPESSVIITISSAEPTDSDKPKVETPSPSCSQPKPRPQPTEPKVQPVKEVFRYGNYLRYYGKRNEKGALDVRLSCFLKDWFKGKDVLDIGCNIGHITWSIGRDYAPRKIVGIDIDNRLIKIAKKNMRHYLPPSGKPSESFPKSFVKMYGRLDAPNIPMPTKIGDDIQFPYNVSFVAGNYIGKGEEILERTKAEYDVILCLSITKWVHLNWGDQGIMRLFHRVFKHLRPGGKFILEPQPWHSYHKRKKLSLEIQETFKNLQIRPRDFPEILLKQVGFSAMESIGYPKHKSQGFERPLLMFFKDEEDKGNSSRTPTISLAASVEVDPLQAGSEHSKTTSEDGQEGLTKDANVVTRTQRLMDLQNSNDGG